VAEPLGRELQRARDLRQCRLLRVAHLLSPTPQQRGVAQGCAHGEAAVNAPKRNRAASTPPSSQNPSRQTGPTPIQSSRTRTIPQVGPRRELAQRAREQKASAVCLFRHNGSLRRGLQPPGRPHLERPRHLHGPRVVPQFEFCSAHRRLILRLRFLLMKRRCANHHPAATPRPNTVPLQASIIMRSDIGQAVDAPAARLVNWNAGWGPARGTPGAGKCGAGATPDSRPRPPLV
jgi:hypothetical protein